MKGFLLTVLLVFIREDEGKPTVYHLPRFPAVFIGDDVTLRCQGRDQPITWYLNNIKLSHQGQFLQLTAVTPEENGRYSCEQQGQRSDPYTLTVLMLEPHAQLSPPAGGPVIAKGEARLLSLRVDDGLTGWKCFAFRNNSGFRLHMFNASVYAELQDAPSATFWCMHNTSKHRSNAVTLKMTERLVMLEPPASPALRGDSVTLRCSVWGGGDVERADFYRDTRLISGRGEKRDTYVISKATESNEGQYTCVATYRYSHISPEAVGQTAGSDPQLLKVIAGPPAAHLSVSDRGLHCSCQQCPDCRTYHWYQTDESHTRRRIAETSQDLYSEKAGVYSCRVECKDGFSRFSKEYNYRGVSGGGGVLAAVVAALLIVLGVLIIVLVALKCRRRQENRTLADTDRNKDQTGGDYEQIGLTDKVVYHTLSESAEQTPAEGGYQALKKTDETKGVYHTLNQGQGEGQGGYEPLQNVKVQVYQTLSSEQSKTAEGEPEGGYEHMPQKTKVTEENLYEELKTEKS